VENLPIASTALRLLAGVTIIFQLGLLAAVPIPSPVSSRRVWLGCVGKETSSGKTGATDPFATRLLPAVALAGLAAVIAAAIRPEFAEGHFLPAGTRLFRWLSPASGLCLLTGNFLIAAAVFTLRRATVFDATGQSRRLVTGGVFGLMQHPVVCGMGMIYLGFFLALPSPLVLGGLLCFGWHQQRRLSAEEALLAERFGPRYRDYRRRVGRFGPHWPGCAWCGPGGYGKE